jgi:hypothetical protein
MTIKAASSTKSYLVIGGLCVAAIAGGSSLAMLTKSSKASAVPNDLTKEALRAQAKETPGQVFEKMRETMQREDLTDEQRQKVRENMREVGREMMEERVNEYFAAATEEEKKAILDRQIDEFMKMREEWEKRREEREKQGEKDGEPSDRQNWMAQQSQQERKERSESRSADQMAKMMVYFSAVQARATERGIKMPGRGGPGGFGMGGGRGGRGP